MSKWEENLPLEVFRCLFNEVALVEFEVDLRFAARNNNNNFVVLNVPNKNVGLIE